MCVVRGSKQFQREAKAFCIDLFVVCVTNWRRRENKGNKEETKEEVKSGVKPGVVNWTPRQHQLTQTDFELEKCRQHQIALPPFLPSLQNSAVSSRRKSVEQKEFPADWGFHCRELIQLFRIVLNCAVLCETADTLCCGPRFATTIQLVKGKRIVFSNTGEPLACSVCQNFDILDKASHKICNQGQL